MHMDIDEAQAGYAAEYRRQQDAYNRLYMSLLIDYTRGTRLHPFWLRVQAFLK